MATPRVSGRAKTPSRRVVEASQPIDTPVTKKRKRRAVSIIDISDVSGESEDVEGEVTEGEEDEDEVASGNRELTEDERLAALDYESIWRLINEKNNEINKKVYLLTGDVNSYLNAHSWAVKQAPSVDQYVRRFKVRIFSKAMAQKDAFETDIDSSDEWKLAVKKALQFKEEGWLQLRIDITLYLKKDTPVPLLAAPATLITPGNITPAPDTQRRGRATATTRQLGALDEAVERQEDAGDYSQSIRIRWPCAVPACNNHRGGTAGYCYWRSSNSKDGHYPITKDVVKAWSQDIKDGIETVKRPSIAVMELLAKAQKRLDNQSHNHKSNPSKNVPYQPVTSQPFYQFIGINPADIFSTGQLSKAADPPSSSAPTETPPFEVIAELFEYLKQSIDWRGDELAKDLDQIQAQLHADGYDINGINGLSSEDWLAMGLKRGQRDKFKGGVVKYRLKRKKDHNVSD